MGCPVLGQPSPGRVPVPPAAGAQMPLAALTAEKISQIMAQGLQKTEVPPALQDSKSNQGGMVQSLLVEGLGEMLTLSPKDFGV